MDRPEYRCPVLMAAAMMNRLTSMGIQVETMEHSMFGPLLIGRLREEHGCSGPDRNGHCPWQMAAMGLTHVRVVSDSPELKGNATGKQTGQFL